MAGRKSTKFPGVQARESESRRYRGRPDICYTIDYRDAQGKRIRKDVGWASQGFTAALAAEMRAKLINAARTEATLGTAPVPAAPAFSEAYLRYEKDWLIPAGKSITGSRQIMRCYLEEISHLALDKITAYEIDQLMARLRARGLSVQTIRHVVGLVRAVMLRMVKWGLYAGQLPFAQISLPRPNNARERFLTPEEAQALLGELKRRSLQTWLMALTSLHCGLRFGEIARLTFGDIDYEAMTIFIAQSKNGCARHAVMTKEVATALAALPQGPKNALIFPSKTGEVMAMASAAFRRAVDAIGLNDAGDGSKISDRRQRVVFHTLRHTYASWLAKSGQSQFVIADRLGHHSLAMTYRYTHLMDESRKESADAISRMFHGTPRQS